MRIAMISAGRAGRQDLHVKQLAAALAGLGHQVTRHSPAVAPVAALGRTGQQLAQAWAEGGLPDVVHAHSWMDCVVAMAATRLPLVVTSHGETVSPENAVCRAADQLIAQCSSQAGGFSRLGVGQERIKLIRPGADTSLFRPRQFDLRSGPLQRILVIGRSNDDGLATLIRALPQLPEAELVIAGALPGAKLLSLARDLWVDGRVFLLGEVAWEHMPALYRSADVVASLRAGDPCSPVIQEAMACGVPVVAYRNDDAVHYVVDGRTGLLVPPGDIFALTTALSRVLADRLSRVHLGSAGRRRAEEQFTWSRVASRVEQVYQEAIRCTQLV